MITLTPRQIELSKTILFLERLVMQYKVWIDQLLEELEKTEEPDLSVWIKAFEGKEKGK